MSHHAPTIACSILAASLFWAIPAPAQTPDQTYDCQARISSAQAAPAPTPDETAIWQCPAGSLDKMATPTHWLRNSLEYCRLTVSVYDNAARAAERLKHGHHYRRHGWIVFMDADETVLDNSLYSRERDMCGGGFSDPVWESWIHARETPNSPPGMARDVPGAAAFTQRIHAMGGLVAIVTNRSAADDAITQDNLKREGIWFDYEIGWNKDDPADASKDKAQRWRDAAGALAKIFHASPRPAMWIGDQITDFAILDRNGGIDRAMTEADGGNAVGDYLFVIPNPMYGVWMGNHPQ
jgi:5'-nucleotidase (lipoprotein e(P4) family)